MLSRDKIQRLLLEHERRLQLLKEKKAQYGLETPVSILTEMEDIQREIEELEAARLSSFNLTDIVLVNKPNVSTPPLLNKSFIPQSSLFWLTLLGGFGLVIIALVILISLVLLNGIIPSIATNSPEAVDISNPNIISPSVPTLTRSPTQTPTPLPIVSQVFIEYILSSTNSMLQPFGTTNKQTAARRALAEHWQNLPQDVNVGLRVYGHRYNAADQIASCGDTELLASPTIGQIKVLTDQLDRLETRGLAPLTETLFAAAGDFNYLNTSTAIILIADSGDTCQRDPCTWVQTQVREAGLPLSIHVIDLSTNETAQTQLACLAANSHGQYRKAIDEASLITALNELSGYVLQSAR